MSLSKQTWWWMNLLSDVTWKKYTEEEPHVNPLYKKLHGLQSLIRYYHQLWYCGYVGIPEGEVLYGVNYDDDVFNSIRAHGGLTYSGTFLDLEPHMDKSLWWLGFDCRHGSDYDSEFRGSEYWVRNNVQLAYVVQETVSLAKQVSELLDSIDPTRYFYKEVEGICHSSTSGK